MDIVGKPVLWHLPSGHCDVVTTLLWRRNMTLLLGCNCKVFSGYCNVIVTLFSSCNNVAMTSFWSCQKPTGHKIPRIQRHSNVISGLRLKPKSDVAKYPKNDVTATLFWGCNYNQKATLRNTLKMTSLQRCFGVAIITTSKRRCEKTPKQPYCNVVWGLRV